MKGFLDNILVTLSLYERPQRGDVHVCGLMAASGRKTTASLHTRVSDGEVQAEPASPWCQAEHSH